MTLFRIEIIFNGAKFEYYFKTSDEKIINMIKNKTFMEEQHLTLNVYSDDGCKRQPSTIGIVPANCACLNFVELR